MASIFGKNFKTFDELKSTLEKNVYLVPFLLAIGYWLLAIGVIFTLLTDSENFMKLYGFTSAAFVYVKNV